MFIDISYYSLYRIIKKKGFNVLFFNNLYYIGTYRVDLDYFGNYYKIGLNR